MENFHAIIIGGGPGGAAAAKTLALAGKQVALISDELGGECLNYGCIPTKTYLWTADLLEKIARAQTFGIEVGALAGGAKVNWGAMKERRTKVVEKLKKGLEFTLKKAGVKMIVGRAILEDATTVKVGEEILKTEFVIIATGSHAFYPDGFEPNGHRIGSREILDLAEIPKTLLIIGGGVVGVEFASVFAALGSQVTIVERADRLLEREDPEISAELERVFARKNIKIIKNATTTPGQTEQYEKVLVSTGRKAFTDLLGLEKAGVQVEKHGVQTNELMRTNVGNIYAVGDVAGKSQLAYTAEREGEIAARAILGQNPKPLNYKTIPNTIFSLPEIASVGLTEPEARKLGQDLAIGKSPYSFNAKALIMDCRDGFVKVIAEKATGKILGVHIIGERAVELIGEASLALTTNMNLETFAENLHSHPVLGEVLKEACIAAM